MPRRAEVEKQLPPFDLKGERESRNLSQEAVAAILFTTQGSVARWEKEGSTPRIYREYWSLYWQVNATPKRAVKKATEKTVKKNGSK